MQTLLVILVIFAMAATVFALVRGIVIFLKTSRSDLDGTGPSLSGERQNRMMRMRIAFQALAIILVVLLLTLMSARG